jgi:hypothetical protein
VENGQFLAVPRQLCAGGLGHACFPDLVSLIYFRDPVSVIRFADLNSLIFNLDGVTVPKIIGAHRRRGNERW